MMAAAAAACVTMNSCNQGGVSADATLGSQNDSLSYAVGVNVGNNIKASAATFPGEDSLKIDLVIKGLLTVLKDSAAQKMTFENANAYINAYIMKIQQAEAEGELKIGQEFLAANRSKEGVVTTASGLQYKVITEGKGDTEKFLKDMNSDAVKQKIKADMAISKRLGVNETPTIYINGKAFELPSAKEKEFKEKLREAINEQLKS